MRDVTATYRDGRDAHLSNIYIRNDFNFVIYKTNSLICQAIKQNVRFSFV